MTVQRQTPGSERPRITTGSVKFSLHCRTIMESRPNCAQYEDSGIPFVPCHSDRAPPAGSVIRTKPDTLRQRQGFMSSRLTRGHVDQFVAVENVLCLVAVEIAFPSRNDHGGNAVADQIAERARYADEPVDRQHQHDP